MPHRARVLAVVGTVGAAVVGSVIALAAPASAIRPVPDPSTITAGPSRPTAAAAVSPSVPSRPVAGGGYVVPTPICGTPRPGRMSCSAIAMEPATRNQPGAVPARLAATGNGPAGGYTPAQLASVYGFDPNTDASGQTVAIVDAYGYEHARADLNHFDAQYGLPAETATSLRIVNQSGQASPLPPLDKGWAREIALDLQAVRGVCRTCKILLVEASTSYSSSLRLALATAIRLGATVVSNSYGAPEGRLSAAQRAGLTRAYNHPGVVITASTGDAGWYDWEHVNVGQDSGDSPQFPASIPGVVAVGGTTLTVDAAGRRASETVWNNNGPSDRYGLGGAEYHATGGGCSRNFTAPSWQLSVAGWSRQGCGSHRLAADVSALGDPETGYAVYNSIDGQWRKFGGTSLSSPIVAAMWALAGGARGVAHPAQALYDNLRFAAQRGYPFHDVTQGSNAFCGGASTTACSAYLRAHTSPATGDPNALADAGGALAGLTDCHWQAYPSTARVTDTRQCVATTGYDGPSGVGTPNGLNGFRSLAPTVRLTYTAPLAVHRSAAFHVSDYRHAMPGSHAVRFTWSWGDGTRTVNNSSTTRHAFAGPGTFTVTLTVTDNDGRQATSSVVITVGAAPSAHVEAPTTVRVGQRVSFHAISTVHNTGATIVAHHWRIGRHTYLDGNPVTFTFRSPGTYTVLLAVYDDTGSKGVTTVWIRVVA